MRLDRKRLYQRLHIGRRTFKTAVAVVLSLILVSMYGATSSKMIFAMMGAMNAMEPTFRKSVEACLTQIVGMIFGILVGVLLLQLPIHPLIGIGIGMVLMISLYNLFHIHFSPALPCMIIVMIFTTPDMLPLSYGVGRLWDTAIGLGVGMLINVLVLPYDNSGKIEAGIEYLKEEVVLFLEDMFDGDQNYPNTEKLTTIVTEMAEQLGLLSEQWFPLRRKQNARKLAILKECEGKSRQLLAQMEVFARMGYVGQLSEENLRKLKAAGVRISSKKVQKKPSDDRNDVITNYHVQQILCLREELIEELSQIPEKKTKTSIISHKE